MAEQIRTRCTAGWLVITDQAVKVERKGIGGHMEMLPRQSVVGVAMKNQVPSVFGKGGGVSLVFNGTGGMLIKADMVNPGDAKKIMELLGFA